MGWTMDTFKVYTRSLNPRPDQGTILQGAALPGYQHVRALSDHPARQVNDAFSRFDDFVGSNDVARLLSYDYRDERGQARHMSGLGAHKSGFWSTNRGMHMTYASDTIGDGKGTQYYNFVMGSGSSDQVEAIGARNGAVVALGPWAGRLVTAGFGVIIPRAELRGRLGVASERVADLSAALYAAQYNSPHTHIEKRGNTAVAHGPYGKAEVTSLMGDEDRLDLVLGFINNVRSWTGFWGRDYFNPGLVGASPRLFEILKDQAVNSAPEIGSVGNHRVHALYSAANALIGEGTGVGR